MIESLSDRFKARNLPPHPPTPKVELITTFEGVFIDFEAGLSWSESPDDPSVGWWIYRGPNDRVIEIHAVPGVCWLITDLSSSAPDPAYKRAKKKKERGRG